MSVTDAESLLKVKQWLSFGDEDLQLAPHALTLSSSAPYRLIAYHAQQFAEKHLKAYLVFHNVDFPDTHNIARLLELCAEKATWPDTVRDSEELTPFAITTRYPGEDEEVTKEEALRAIDIASNARDVVRNALQREGFAI